MENEFEIDPEEEALQNSLNALDEEQITDLELAKNQIGQIEDYN